MASSGAVSACDAAWADFADVSGLDVAGGTTSPSPYDIFAGGCTHDGRWGERGGAHVGRHGW